jgi:hypothetical protein
MNSLLYRRKMISPSILAVFHNGKQEMFTFSYPSGEDGIINEYIKSTAHLFINIYTPGKPDGLNIMLSKLKGICNFRLRPSVEENLQTCAW